MGQISASTVRRIYLLYLLSRFSKGAYGALRVQKVAYLSERFLAEVDDSAVRPFRFKKYHFGQYSQVLADIEVQLVGMDYVQALPLDTAKTYTLGESEFIEGGNKFTVTNRSQAAFYRKVLKLLSPHVPTIIDRTVKLYGYKPEPELIDLCYSFPDFQAAQQGQILLEANVSDLLEVDLTDDECEALELAMRPEFIVPLARIAKALESTNIDWDQVEQVEGLPVPRS
jgi:hypothetical protein